MIRELRLRNFKCFGDVRIPFGPLTLLTGINSSGKSSTIQSLLLLRQSWTPLGTQVRLNGELTQLGHPNDVLSEDAEDSADNDRISINVEGDNASLSFELTLEEGESSFATSDHLSSATLSKLSLFGNCFQYLKAERVGPRVLSETSEDHVKDHRELGPAGEYTAHFLSVLGAEPVTSSNLFHPLGSGKSLLAQTEAWLSEITPGVQLSIIEHPDMDVVSLGVSFSTPGQVRSERYRPTNVGFGLTYVLPVIVAVLAARAGDLLIIENPEAHLHPKGQARIGRMLALAAEAGIQIVVETHSDHVLNGIRLAAKAKEVEASKIVINFFRRLESVHGKGSGIINPVIDSDGRVDLWPRGFFDEWENSLDSLLT
jgi:predicted ATPase